MSLLETRAISKSFGGVVALDAVDLKIETNSITALIGPNGSGKTTLFNVLSGFIPPDSGRVIFMEKDITGLSPDRISLKGLTRTFQIPRLFSKMTLLENMLTAPKNQSGEGLARLFTSRKEIERQETRNADNAMHLLNLLGIDHLANEYAANLSGGQQKLLELGRALMTDPDMILLDEPVAGVNPTLAKKVFERIIELRNSLDKTFLVVEHNMDIVMNFCDRIGVMHRGQLVAEGTPKEIARNEQVLQIYLGMA
ncbi:MAG: ABC transporter ATP-binding protein [Thaumarchaeota archaeon]|nr:ABC transporter ATP-binding protein [Nitrososphaerota archaeon]